MTNQNELATPEPLDEVGPMNDERDERDEREDHGVAVRLRSRGRLGWYDFDNDRNED